MLGSLVQNGSSLLVAFSITAAALSENFPGTAYTLMDQVVTMYSVAPLVAVTMASKLLKSVF